MNPQLPAEGILTSLDMGDYKCYTIQCRCGDNDHEMTISVESDETGIIVTSYTKQITSWWETIVTPYVSPSAFGSRVKQGVKRFINSLYHRLKVTWCVWVHGYVKYSTTTILSEQQALNVASALVHSIESVKNHRRNIDGKEI